MFEKFTGSIEEKLGREALAELSIFGYMVCYEYHILFDSWDLFILLYVLSEAGIHIFQEVPMRLESDVVVSLLVIISSLQD
jgi:hypothetical protein